MAVLFRRHLARCVWSLLALATVPTLPAMQGAPSRKPGTVIPAEIITRVQPAYPVAAHRAGVQGTVLLGVGIDKEGVPSTVRVISPLGFGLDESAVEAVKQWRYRPTKLNGEPVSVFTMVSVNFSLSGIAMDRKRERQRTDYNSAVTLLRGGSRKTETALKSLEKLAGEGFEPALYLCGVLNLEGKLLPADPILGMERIRRAAGEEYGPALEEMGLRYLRGEGLAKDEALGYELLQKAADRGGTRAQLLLGMRYASGEGVEKDLRRADRYLRLAGAAGDGDGQYELGKLQLESRKAGAAPGVEAMAWLYVAGTNGHSKAKELLAEHLPSLNSQQRAAMERIASQLVPSKR